MLEIFFSREIYDFGEEGLLFMGLGSVEVVVGRCGIGLPEERHRCAYRCKLRPVLPSSNSSQFQ